MKVFQIMSGIILPVLFGRYVEEIYGFDLTEEETMKEFIRLSVACPHMD